MYPMMEKTLKDFYNVKDTQGQTHTGFLQAMDFSGMSFPVLNEITISILDAYIFNRLSHCVALRQWGDYLQYDKDAKEIRIDAAFYSAFVSALFVELMEADKYNTTILKGDFSALSAKDLKKVTYGEKTTNKHYDTVVVEITKGNDTEGTTARTDQHSETAYKDTEKLGARSDSHSETAHTDTITPGTETDEHLRFALGGSVYNEDTKDVKTHTATNNAYGATSGSASIGQQENETDYGARSSSDTIGAQTVTKTFGDKTTETDARNDSEVILSRIDQEEHTKHILISPEKFFEIEKELASINAYTIVSDAVKHAFAASYWG